MKEKPYKLGFGYAYERLLNHFHAIELTTMRDGDTILVSLKCTNHTETLVAEEIIKLNKIGLNRKYAEQRLIEKMLEKKGENIRII